MTGAARTADLIDPDGELAAGLVARLVAAGQVTDPRWREVLAGIPRHLFTPDVAVMEGPHRRMRLLSGHDPAQRRAWLEAVYSDQTLITQIDARPVADAFANGRQPEPGSWTSSSTTPGVMAELLHALDVADGMTVLEIGTGTGYNAAMLCARLGDYAVTTIDVDPDLTAAARQRLAGLGYRPAIVTGDGAAGDADHAPYDRVLATVSWPWLPKAWIAQTRRGGLIIANILGQLGGGIVALTVDADGTASGRFLPCWIGFMPARNTLPRMRDITAIDTADGSYDTSTTSIDPAILTDRSFALLAQAGLTNTQPYRSHDESGRPLSGLLATDGSWAETYHHTDATGKRQVDQGGTRRLWNDVEDLYRFWNDRDRPDWTQFGLTATPTHQYLWYETPTSAHTWPLSTLPA